MVGLAVLPPLLVGVMVARDLVTRRSVHLATAWGAAIAIAGQLLPLLVWRSEAWLAFAAWAAGLVA